MKRFKKLGILLAILVVFCIGTVLVSQYEEKQEQIRTGGDVILTIPAEEVTALSWAYSEEEGLAFHYNGEGWVYDEDEAFPVSEEKVSQILAHFENFSASFIIEDVEDYSQYGLEEPECTFRLSTEAADYEMKLGAVSKMDEQRYIDIGDGNVYLVSEDPMDYVDAALSSMILHDDTPGFETVVDIRFEGSESYIINRIDDSAYSYSDEDIYFVQKNGQYLPLDTASVRTVLNTITSLDLTEYVTYNASDEDLASYGLDAPELSVTVNYTYTDENEETVSDVCLIHLSRNPEELAAAEEAEANGETASDVTRYVRIGDSRIVYTVDKVDYAILAAVGYDDLRHKEVFWGNQDAISKIEILLEDTWHTLVSEYTEDEERVWYYGQLPNMEEAPLGTTEAAEETTETSEETAATEPEVEPLDLEDLLDALEDLTADSFTSELPTDKEEIRLVLSLDDANFPEVEIVLYRYDGTMCLVQVDGEPVSLVSRADVMALVEAVQAIVLNQ